uniref:Uncharacterized protein n=2 Tax=viral metagenome TaxID=1070528 RepID=A0A6M3XZG7_9ZZZZ
MKKRETLNGLVVAALETSGPMKANRLYGKIMADHPEVMRSEKVEAFKSFVQVLNQFGGVERVPGDRYAKSKNL